ncbi:hypothetical protein A2U01_0101601, partial [Trifolium medium]|nr:hypothetical protein [Trifolium medium]
MAVVDGDVGWFGGADVVVFGSGV